MAVKKWYQAWVNKDYKTLETLLHPEMYGYRSYDETLMFSSDDVVLHLKEHNINDVLFTSLEVDGNTSLYELRLIDPNNTTHNIVGKAVFDNNKLVQLYETIATTLRRIKVVCSYDGSAFSGYQRQPHHKTVQGTIERAIKQALDLDHEVTIHASGRTDKGVHARHQVFHFDVDSPVPIDRIASLIQTRLPQSIYLHHAQHVHPTFHSRYDISQKTYQYKIHTGEFDPIQRQYEWTVQGLDIDQLKQDAESFVGTHDFQSFTVNTTKKTVRTIYNIDIKQTTHHILITVTGNGFLRYMVRYMIFALVERNLGRLSMSINDLLTQKDIHILNQLAPPSGLYLEDVSYQ